MKRKFSWIVVLTLVVVFRNSLWHLLPFDNEEFSLAAVGVSVIGGICAYFLARSLVVVMELNEVWQVLWMIVGSGILANILGHWLTGFPLFGEFWGGFVCGSLKTAFV